MAGFCKEKIEDLVPADDFCTICKKIRLHEAICEMRPVSCKFCHNFVVYSQVITHEMNCPDRYITECKECTLNFNSSVIEATTHRCPREVVDCNLCAVECCSAMCPGHFMRCEIDEKCASPSQTAKMVGMIFLLKQQLVDTLSGRRSENVSIDGESRSSSSSRSSSNEVINNMAGGKRLRAEASDTSCSSGLSFSGGADRPRKKTDSVIDVNAAALSTEDCAAICDENATTSLSTDTTARLDKPIHVVSELIGSNNYNSSVSDSASDGHSSSSSSFLYSFEQDLFFTPTYWPDEYPSEEEEEEEENVEDDISCSTPNRVIGSPTESRDNKMLVLKSCDVSVFGVSVNSPTPLYRTHVPLASDDSNLQSTTSSPTNSPIAPKIRKKFKKKIAAATMTLKEKTELKNREVAQKIAQSIQPIYKSYQAAVESYYGGGVMHPPVNNNGQEEELNTFSSSSAAYHHQEERYTAAQPSCGVSADVSFVYTSSTSCEEAPRRSSLEATNSSSSSSSQQSDVDITSNKERCMSVTTTTTTSGRRGLSLVVVETTSSRSNTTPPSPPLPPPRKLLSSRHHWGDEDRGEYFVDTIEVKEEVKEEVFVIKVEECDMMV